MCLIATIIESVIASHLNVDECMNEKKDYYRLRDVLTSIIRVNQNNLLKSVKLMKRLDNFLR